MSGDKSARYTGTPGDGALKGEAIYTDFAKAMSYGGYLQLDRILDAQSPRSGTHDEMLFVIIHQVSELWMKLMLHELEAALALVRGDTLRPAFKMLARVKRIQEQLIGAWSVLTTMTPADYSRFRDALGQSSGFQSYQYRSIEFTLGNKQPAMLKPHAHDAVLHGELKALLERPSLYDEAIRMLARRGFAIEAGQLERDWAEPHGFDQSVHDAWLAVYREPERYWELYEFAENLLDIEDLFETWRFRHANTVERIIGMKKGTGGTSGVQYLRRQIGTRIFAELWAVRTEV
ncbi:MAG TPA: tryptophan 2,3-dioxygenase [Acidocella sp.]|nr:tryptophan 2,3-dioxygenase [Acidocella sp.]